jgi:hypothetical protein
MGGAGQVVTSAVGYWPLIVAFLGSLGLGGMLKSWLDYRHKARKQTDDMATAIVATLTGRLDAVEAQQAQERALCEANLGVLRHRMNNLSGSFDGLLLLIEMAPEKAAEFVARIKEQRAAQELAEAAEKAAVMTATLTAAGKPSPAPPAAAP